MRILGFEITRTSKAAPALSSIPGDRGNWWWPLVREPFTGAWQRNQEIRLETSLSYSAVYACISLIASDVSKINLRLVEEQGDDIWTEVSVPAFSPVLRKPNRYQTRIKFIEQWVTSKLIHGNTYVLKEFDGRGVVAAMYVLDPTKVKPLVAEDSSVWYQVNADNLAGVEQQITIPASQIIHDTAVCLYHPLCGISPLSAALLAASQGLSIQNNSNKFFQNGSNPGGVLTAPGPISDEVAKRLKDYWETNYTGNNVGKVAVLGDGLKYEAMAVKAVEAQLLEQLKWTAETVCSVFHVPPYMIGVGAMPAYNNIEALNQQYYSQCLQVIMECIEALLDEGLKLNAVIGRTYGTEFDLHDLLKMDTATKVKSWSDLVAGAIASPNEARAAFNLGPVEGGDSPMIQQQNYSLAALAKRDAKEDPFASAAPPPPPANDDEPPEDDEEPQDDEEDDSEMTETNLAQFVFEVRSGLHNMMGSSP